MLLAVPKPEDIVKTMVTMVISVKVTQVASKQIESHTPLDPESLSVRVGAGMTGYLVAATVKPTTDQVVDRAFAIRRPKFRNKNSE
jgi:hypothetical protein